LKNFTAHIVLALSLCIGLITTGYGQVGIDIGPSDTAACGGTGLELFAQYDYINQDNVLEMGSVIPTTEDLTDDSYTGIVNIGFDFVFFGNTYNQCLISSNNYITFDLADASGYSPWAIGNAIPNAGAPLNAIFAPWQDTNPGIEGTISYTTIGTAPNRAFIYSFLEVSMFSCTDLCFINQVIIYETSNIIETYVGDKPNCESWNGGAAILGLHNIDGSVAVVPSNYNFPNIWTVNEEAWRFTPDGIGSYNATQIAFEPAGLPVEATWFEVGVATPIGMGSSMVIDVSTTTDIYAVFLSNCSGNTYTDTITVTIGNTQMTAAPVSTSCVGFSDGAINVDPTGSEFPIEGAVLQNGVILQAIPGLAGPFTLENLSAGNYQASITDEVGCITLLDVTIEDPDPLTFTTEVTDATCFGFDNGFVITESDGIGIAPLTFTALGTGGAVVSGPENTPLLSATLLGLSAGNYTVAMIDAAGCPALPVEITVNHPNLLIPNAGHFDIRCNGENSGRAFSASFGGTPPYTWTWNDPLLQTTDTIEFLTSGSYTYTVTDAQNCISDTTLTVIEPLPLRLNLSSGPDTCLLGNGAILAEMQGGVTPYTYVWNKGVGDSSRYVVNDLNNWNTLGNLDHGDYAVLVLDSNLCEIEGEISVALIAPPKASFLTRSLPEEFVNPNVRFDNESSFSETYEWYFGDGTVSYQEYPEHVYDTSGTFLVMLIASNEPEFGCADTTYQYVEVDPLFTFYVPSAFTPDGDGLNDTWGPAGQGFEYESYNVKIYDRWSKLIWQTDNPNKQWNGTMKSSLKDVKQGIYVYVFKLKKFNTFEPKVVKGTIMLYRNN